MIMSLKPCLNDLLLDDINVLHFMVDHIASWVGNGKSFEVQNTYEKQRNSARFLRGKILKFLR